MFISDKMKDIQLKKKDFDLLKILGTNSRASLRNISEELKISKQAASLKIKKLEVGIIAEYITIIDFFKLGYNNTHLYLKLQGIERKKHRENILELKKVGNISWIVTLFGDFDLAISIFYESLDEFHTILNKIYRIFGNSIKDKETFPILSQEIFLPQRRQTSILINPTKRIEISDKERKILNCIGTNARFNYANISPELKMECNTIKKNILRLQEKKIIRGYNLICNNNNLGNIWHICILNIVPGKNIKKIIEELRNKEEIPFISITVENKIIFDFICKNYESVRNFLNKLKIDFFNDIEGYRLLGVDELIKLKISF